MPYWRTRAQCDQAALRLGVVLDHERLPGIVAFVEWTDERGPIERGNAQLSLVNGVAARAGRLRYAFLRAAVPPRAPRAAAGGTTMRLRPR